MWDPWQATVVTCARVSPVAPGLWRDGQLHAQRLALVVAGVVDGGVHHVVDVVHQAGHVLQWQAEHGSGGQTGSRRLAGRRTQEDSGQRGNSVKHKPLW